MPVPLAVVGVRERQTASVGGGMKRACRSPVAAVVLLVFALRAVRASSRLAFAASLSESAWDIMLAVAAAAAPPTVVARSTVLAPIVVARPSTSARIFVQAAVAAFVAGGIRAIHR